MSRRVQNLTGASHESVDSDVVRDAHIAQQYLVATELEGLLSTSILQRSLSTKSVVSTTSSFATKFHSLRHLADTQNYREIGAGLQGVVYERLGSANVAKKERSTNQGRQLRDEFGMHQKVSDAFLKYKECSSDVRVPQPFDFIAKESVSPEFLSRMPEDDRKPSDIATMERILPLPKVVRKALIKQFYAEEDSLSDENLVTQLLNERPNKHCLVRVYLGRRRVVVPKESFTLRNFPLTLDMMGRLGLDVMEFATMLGSAYAIMHWAANITGDDTEFVLGTSTTSDNDLQQRSVHLYLIDFGQCEVVDMKEDQDVIFQAFKGSMVLQQNQIYLPHPKRTVTLYQAWKAAYLNTARRVIHHEGLPFDPEEFLVEYEEYLEDFDP
ncbi:hypothetical protein F5Y01DRAFT_311215 [Xylaria sp. FL0043]|nr:hypothetical protein F5Y01DRAFT_311215 [Xylaria sp. FL0043]